MKAYREKAGEGYMTVSWEKGEGLGTGKETDTKKDYYSRQADISQVCLLSIRALLCD